MPDLVGDAVRTKDLYDYFSFYVYKVPRALVIQDGIESVNIDWIKTEAVFVGGSDSFKMSKQATDVCKIAKMMNKWVHVGRVNTVSRLKNFVGIADSVDGSGISRFDHMLEPLLEFIKNGDNQSDMFD